MAAAALLATAGPAAASVQRPATPWESLVVRHADAHLTAVTGAGAPDVPVYVGDCSGGYACAEFVDGRRSIVLTPTATSHAVRYAYVATRPTIRGRQRAIDRCQYACHEVMVTALHELVHVHRLAPWDNPSYPLPAWNAAFEEGLAEAVANDQVCPMERRSLGVTGQSGGIPNCSLVSVSYADRVAALRERSRVATLSPHAQAPAARRWRLAWVINTGGSN